MKGRKTYIVAGLMAIASALYGVGIIDDAVWKTLMGVLNGAAATTIRSALHNETHGKL
jgi:hypothetical protein